MSQIGNRIRALRGLKGWSIRTLAKRAGISFVSISRYENGTVTPNDTSISKLANALKISLEELTSGSNLINSNSQGQFNQQDFEQKLLKAKGFNEELKIELGIIIDRFYQNQVLLEYYSKSQAANTPISIM